MNIFWKYLPLDLVIYILKFDKKIKYHNGKFMNQILELDKGYYNIKKILNKIKSYKNFIKIYYLNNYIGFTKKSIYYYANNNGLRVSLYNENEDNYEFIILYNNMI